MNSLLKNIHVIRNGFYHGASSADMEMAQRALAELHAAIKHAHTALSFYAAAASDYANEDPAIGIAGLTT